MQFNRHRRLRSSESMRNLVKNLSLATTDFVLPLFIEEGTGIKTEIESMPGQYRYSLDMLKPELAEVWELGVRNLILFGIPKEKNPKGTGGYAEETGCPDRW